MTRTVRRLQSIARAGIAEILAAVGTFVLLSWTGVHLVRTLERVIVAPFGVALPELVGWISVLAVATALTIWLERGGYRRLGADQTGGGTAAVLAVVSLPLSVVPAGIVLASLADLPTALLNPFLLACVVVACWLALYGGLERLGLEARQFLVAAALACVVPLAVAIVDGLVGLGGLLSAVAGPDFVLGTTVALAAGWQLVVFVLAFVQPVSLGDRRPRVAALERQSTEE